MNAFRHGNGAQIQKKYSETRIRSGRDTFKLRYSGREVCDTLAETVIQKQRCVQTKGQRRTRIQTQTCAIRHISGALSVFRKTATGTRGAASVGPSACQWLRFIIRNVASRYRRGWGTHGFDSRIVVGLQPRGFRLTSNAKLRLAARYSELECEGRKVVVGRDEKPGRDPCDLHHPPPRRCF